MKHLAVISLVLLAAACTPAQIAWWQDPTVTQADKDAVATALRDQPYEWRSMGENPPDCFAAIDAHWPVSSRAWARRVVWRESRNDPAAQNTRSSAAGCFQLLALHRGRFGKLGYSWADRYDATTNVLVALDLYREVGPSPWSV